MRYFALIFSIFFRLTYGFSVEYTASPGYITLYQDSNVINLNDMNMTEIYNSPSLWLVQFYNHWCGHCQRFAPTWKELANDVKSWSPFVKIAAVNCADQSCDRYQISGTPTIRIFNPNTPVNQMDSAYYGFNMQVQNNKEFYVNNIVHNLGQLTKDRPSFNLDYKWPVPSNNKADLENLFQLESNDVDFIVLLFDNDGLSVGKKIKLDMSAYKDTMAIYRYRMDNSGAWGPMPYIKMVVIGQDGSVLETVDGWGNSYDRQRLGNILKSYIDGDKGFTSRPPPSPSTTVLTITKVPSMPKEDLVYQSDLEKAVQYSLFTEISSQPMFDLAKKDALVLYIDSLLHYFPNQSPEMEGFLKALIQWLRQWQYQVLTPEMFKAKANELSEKHLPFANTPAQWSEGGCAGSSPEKRGYPCSLWTLFHTLMASAADKDPAFSFHQISTVARTMIGYISFFFSCRDCSRNFQEHVTTAMYHPGTPDQSLLWLWSIHNTANTMLAGDPTEDPAAPKIVWPSNENCPTCRTNGFGHQWAPMRAINGEVWNEAEVVKYLRFVYHPSRIVIEDKIKKILEELKEKLNSKSDSIFDEAHDKLVGYCQRR